VNYNVKCALKSHTEKVLMASGCFATAIHLDAGSSLELALPLYKRKVIEDHG
jgi:hypothetical protein